MKYILLSALLFIGTMTYCQNKTMLDKERFEAIVQFVLDNGCDASLYDHSLTPAVEYKNVLVYIIPNSMTTK